MSSLQVLFSLNTTFNSIAKFIKKPSVPLQNDLDINNHLDSWAHLINNGMISKNV